MNIKSLKSWIPVAVTVVLVAGGAVGLGTYGNTVRADMAQSESFAQDYSTATQESAESARAAADDAQEAADAAAEAVTAVAAQEAAAAAAAEAERVANESKAGGKPSGGASGTSAPIKCPAGSMANSGDGPNDTSCFPEVCFHVTLPDPAYPECVTAFKP